MKQFEELIIWQESRSLVNEIYKVHKNYSDFSFKDQIQRASVSVMNNISEGAESGADTSFIRYLKIAKASCAEVRSMLYLSEDLKIISSEEAFELRNKTIGISSRIFQLIKYLKTDSNQK
jgi:four helix bundle protein